MKNKRYRYDADDPNSIGGLNVWDAYRDSGDTLWFGMVDGGWLSRYNPETDNFTRYSHDDNNPNSIADNTVWGIYEDRQNNFWLATNGGLDLLDRKTGKFTHYRQDRE